MAIKILKIKAGDLSAELELKKLIAEGYTITKEEENKRTGESIFTLEEAFNFIPEWLSKNT